MNGADYLISALYQENVECIFGLGGANIEDIYDAVYRQGKIKTLIAKHEASAINMADGYARISGKPGVVMCTSGAGALNLTTGLGEAFSSKVPILAIVGQIPQALHGKGGFQDSSGLGGSFDLEKLFSEISHYCRQVRHIDELPNILAEALACLQKKPSGPAVILLPKNIQVGPAPQKPWQKLNWAEYLQEQMVQAKKNAAEFAQKLKIALQS